MSDTLRPDYTEGGLLWCRRRLHLLDPDAPVLDSGRRCVECRRASHRRAQAKYARTTKRRRAKGFLSRSRFTARKRSA